MATYVIRFRYADKKARDETRPRHREYLAGMRDQGKLIMAGPFADDSGGMVVYEAADEAEVRSWVAADPYYQAGVMGDLDVAEWQVVFGS